MKKLWNKIVAKFSKDWINEDANVYGVKDEVFQELMGKLFEVDGVALYIVPSKMFKGSVYFIEIPINTGNSII